MQRGLGDSVTAATLSLAFVPLCLRAFFSRWAWHDIAAAGLFAPLLLGCGLAAARRGGLGGGLEQLGD
ncbi:MAG: hypothetical protein ACYSXF_03950, partial [Planctomycetota bacterium]